jgi:hypothetical protein
MTSRNGTANSSSNNSGQKKPRLNESFGVEVEDASSEEEVGGMGPCVDKEDEDEEDEDEQHAAF